MRTSNFFHYRGAGRISIARWAPRNIPKGFRVYKQLAPGDWFKSVSAAEYRRRFAKEILKPLDPQSVWDELHELAAPHEPVLLCWCKLHEVGWCHRQIVAEFFERELGFKVTEIKSNA
jgi:hypothetical protein